MKFQEAERWAAGDYSGTMIVMAGQKPEARLRASARASTSCESLSKKDVDGRDEARP